MFELILGQIATMVIMILIGVICYKARLISDQGSKELSGLLMKVISPLILFMSFQREYEAEMLKMLLVLILVSAGTCIIPIILAHFIIPEKRKDYEIERFSLTYANAGCMAIPIVSHVFGQEGLFYLSAYTTVVSFFAFTHGICLLTGGKGRMNAVQAVKNICNPMIICIVTGFLFFVCRITLPARLAEALTGIGNMNTPVAMLLAGVTLAQTPFKEVLFNKQIYWISFLKLLVVPAILGIIIKFLPIPDGCKAIMMIACSTPVAISVVSFSLQYERNARYASALYAVMMVLSIVTIPAVCYFF